MHRRAEARVFNLGVGFDPVEAFTVFAPEPFRVLDRTPVHLIVLILID